MTAGVVHLKKTSKVVVGVGITVVGFCKAHVVGARIWAHRACAYLHKWWVGANAHNVDVRIRTNLPPFITLTHWYLTHVLLKVFQSKSMPFWISVFKKPKESGACLRTMIFDCVPTTSCVSFSAIAQTERQQCIIPRNDPVIVHEN